MPARLIEVSKSEHVFSAASRTATSALFNGSATGAVGIDTKNYNEAVVQLNLGTVASGDSIAAALYENADNDALTATAVTDGGFSASTDADDGTTKVGSIQCKNYKRYLFVRALKTGSNGAAIYSVNATLARPDSAPVTQSEDFDV